MRAKPLSLTIARLAALAVLAQLAACDFEPHLTPMDWSTGQAPEFGEVGTDLGELKESPAAGVARLVNELFDPFNLPGDQPYRGSVYERMDRILAGAYAYYGYDLAELAVGRQDNPLSESDFLDYLVETGQISVTDPATGEEFSTFVWLQRRLGAAADGPIGSVLRKIDGIDESNHMNLEPNYASSLMTAHPEWVVIARAEYRKFLDYYYQGDAVQIYEYLAELDLFMGQQ